MNGQQLAIYNYLKTHGEATYRELNDKLFMRKSDMRIAEMNHAHREKTGQDLIVTIRKQKNKEHVKALVGEAKKVVYEYYFNPYTQCMEERKVEVVL